MSSFLKALSSCFLNGLLLKLSKNSINFSALIVLYESYIDKHRASDYGTYRSTAKKEYYHWIKPQETGSHYASTELLLENGMKITAQTPFSFSVLLIRQNR